MRGGREIVTLVCVTLVSLAACSDSQEIFGVSPDDPDASADAGLAGMAGSAGSAGAAGAAGEGGSAAVGGEVQPGVCNPAFCPTTFGSACCITENGPCGVDLGMGCMLPPSTGDR